MTKKLLCYMSLLKEQYKVSLKPVRDSKWQQYLYTVTWVASSYM